MEIDPEKASASYDEEYFRHTYRNYELQNPPAKLSFYAERMLAVAPSRRPLDILDAGCGLGGFVGHLRGLDQARSQWSVTGTDVSGFAIRQNARRFPGADFEQVAIEDLAKLGRLFDVITAFDVLEHLENVNTAADAVLRSLKADGVFMVVVPVFDGPLGPFIRLVDRDPTHLQIRSRSWWLERIGTYFAISDWIGIFRGLTPFGHYVHRPSRRLRSIAPAILVLARSYS